MHRRGRMRRPRSVSEVVRLSLVGELLEGHCVVCRHALLVGHYVQNVNATMRAHFVEFQIRRLKQVGIGGTAGLRRGISAASHIVNSASAGMGVTAFPAAHPASILPCFHRCRVPIYAALEYRGERMRCRRARGLKSPLADNDCRHASSDPRPLAEFLR